MNQTPLDTPICLPRTQTQGILLLPSYHTHMSISPIRTTAPTVPPKTQLQTGLTGVTAGT